ncbi:ROK family transcriptional regulator [Devosia sp. Root685]|uniref:ROK family transcriptional regulator n=1 Tax=Devosia sp. Root685 TaxID=1736587 RepID=UPI000A5D8460|nr:ROK family transcriptional regulator [Devosia sp. Root685]
MRTRPPKGPQLVGELADRTREPDSVRSDNIGFVLDILRQEGPISRIEISAALELSRSTVTEITAELLNDGLIQVHEDEEAADSATVRGRPRVRLSLNPRAAYAVGVRLGLSQITVSVTDFVCDVLHSSTLPFRSSRQAPEVVADVVEDAILRTVADCDLKLSDINAVCVGVPGMVDSKLGICHWSPAFSRIPVPFADLLSQRLNIPVVIETHTVPLATAERNFGSAQDQDTCVVITLGHGVGMGILINGEVYRGAHGFASEFSHTKIEEGGPLCECGQHGCLEAHIGFRAILQAAGEEVAGPVSEDPRSRERKVLELIERADAGNEHLRTVFAQVGTYLGRSLANLCGVIDPARIIFSGLNMRSSHYWLEPAKTALFANVRAPMQGRLEFVVNDRDDVFWSRGAAALVLHQLYRSPLLLRAKKSAAQ